MYKKIRRRSFIRYKECIIYLLMPLQSGSAAGIYGSQAVSSVHIALQSKKRECNEHLQQILLKWFWTNIAKRTNLTHIFPPQKGRHVWSSMGTCAVWGNLSGGRGQGGVEEDLESICGALQQSTHFRGRSVLRHSSSSSSDFSSRHLCSIWPKVLLTLTASQREVDVEVKCSWTMSPMC